MNLTIKVSKQEERFNYWPSLHYILIALLISLSVASCKKEDDAPSDEYYVKYEVNSETIYLGGKIDLTINTEDNEDLILVINQRTLHETTIGPVPKGFNASMDVMAQGNTHDKLKLYTNIYVSKNGSPFALKKSDGNDQPRDFVQLSYTVDY